MDDLVLNLCTGQRIECGELLIQKYTSGCIDKVRASEARYACHRTARGFFSSAGVSFTIATYCSTCARSSSLLYFGNTCLTASATFS